MKLTIYMYEWIESEGIFRIYDPDHENKTFAYALEDGMAQAILKQQQDGRRYLAADPGSYLRMVHAIAMKVFVHYKEDET